MIISVVNLGFKGTRFQKTITSVSKFMLSVSQTSETRILAFQLLILKSFTSPDEDIIPIL